jgi:hypothetical protein
MRIVEVCPECGSDIEYSEICTNPPIPVRRCTKCSWKWEGEPEETVRVPFNPEGYGQCELTVPKGEYELKVPVIVAVHMNT